MTFERVQSSSNIRAKNLPTNLNEVVDDSLSRDDSRDMMNTERLAGIARLLETNHEMWIDGTEAMCLEQKGVARRTDLRNQQGQVLCVFVARKEI